MYGATMSQSFPSVGLIAAEAKAELESQMRHFESLDTKAGLVLGFSGVLVAVSGAAGGPWLTSARLIAGLAAGVALMAFVPRRFPALDVRALRDEYIRAEESFTRMTLIDTRIEMTSEAASTIQKKAWLNKIGLALLLASVVVLAAGTILGEV